MALTISTATRTAMAQAIITQAGAGAKLKFFNGAKPAALGAPAGTLLGTLTAGATLGVASAGVLDFDEAGLSQTTGSHVSGTPTFVRVTTSGDVAIADIDIGAGAGNWQFTGTIATGQAITATTLALTMPNAA